MSPEDSWVLRIVGPLGLGVASALAALIVGGLIFMIVGESTPGGVQSIGEGFGILWVLMAAATCGIVVFACSLTRVFKNGPPQPRRPM